MHLNKRAKGSFNLKVKKKNKWIKKRHAVVLAILRVILFPFLKFQYRVKLDKFKIKKGERYLILFNHQTPFDQFFVGTSIKGPIYYLATEDIFSKGWVSSVIRFLVAPIPIKKQTNDIRAVLNCKRVANEGGSIALAPEGNRTYSGKTEYIKSSIAGLAKLLKLPIIFYKIEGGYGKQPRWSNSVRGGKMQAGISKILQPEEYLHLSDDELLKIIQTELYVNDNDYSQKCTGKALAENMERLFYVCPKCGFATFKTKGDIITCNSCGLSASYLPDKTFNPKSGDFTFKTVNDWYEYQCDFIRNTNLSGYVEKPVFTDESSLSEVVVYKRKTLIEKSVKVSLYGDKIVVDTKKERLVWNFSDITAASVLGRNKVNVYLSDKIYQFKSNKSFNAIKYVNFYYAYQNSIKGDSNEQFLGL